MEQLKNIDKSINQTKLLVNKSGSLNKGILNVVEIKDKNILYQMKIPGNSDKRILAPSENKDALNLCYFSFGSYDYNFLKANTDFAVLALQINYTDILTKIKKVELFYRIWIPAQNQFGGGRDWQIELAKKYALDKGL